MTSRRRAGIRLLAAAASGGLLVFAFPRHTQGWLAWVGLVPLLLVLPGRSLKEAFLLAYVTGVVFYSSSFAWMFEVAGYTFLQHILLHLFLGGYLGLFGLAFAFLCRRSGAATALIAVPFLWISLEYVRSHMGFLSYPTVLLAHSQHAYPRVIQIASITGAYGVSFLVAAANAALAGAAGRRQDLSRKERAALGAAAAAMAAATLIYGHVRVSSPLAGKEIRVAVVQGNIAQGDKWDPRHAGTIMHTYEALTREAARGRPAMIVWPETATPWSITKDPALRREIARIAKNAEAYLLLGSASHQKFQGAGARKAELRNSAFLFPPDGRDEAERYDKIRLLPFGEYLPLEGIVPWSYLGIPDLGRYIPGEKVKVLQGPGFRFAATICWENIFPEIVRRSVREGAQVIVNISNEAWFGRGSCPYQFLSVSVLRAVENGSYVVRCANTGISCFIDPRGRVVDRVRGEDGREIFVQGVLSGVVAPRERETIYTRSGEIIVWLSMIISLGFLIEAIRTKTGDRSA